MSLLKKKIFLEVLLEFALVLWLIKKKNLRKKIIKRKVESRIKLKTSRYKVLLYYIDEQPNVLKQHLVQRNETIA